MLAEGDPVEEFRALYIIIMIHLMYVLVNRTVCLMLSITCCVAGAAPEYVR